MARLHLRTHLLALAAILCTMPVAAADVPTLGQYLPEGVSYDPAIPKPADVLGFEVGEWHVRHDLLVAYMRALAEASPRVQLEVTGHTHEARPLILLTISDPANLARIDDIRQTHLRLSDPAARDQPVDDQPVVVHLGYSVHGDEASGANASLAVAYHLAAAEDEATRRWLREAVILLDPSLNPDGLGRFAQWVNMHRGDVLVGDPNHREHNQAWPSGRTNHYWFDLNRDWLLAQHPESRARLATFHRWRPNVHTDHHEMGTDSTFFFQPGVPSRKNPLTPDENAQLTAKIAAYHSQVLDRKGRLYYTEETFDDFYYGKGSTYPDIHGSVGILFEQASARGHLQESASGPLPFPFAIENQVAVSFSTLAAAVDLRRDLLDYQMRFFRDAAAEVEAGTLRGWIFGDGGDVARARAMIEVLDQHHIAVQAVGRGIEIGGRRYEPGAAWVVAAAQPQGRLARALFEHVKEFADSTFYDVSTWTLPHAFGLPFTELDAAALRTVSAAPEREAPAPALTVAPRTDVVAWAIDWDSYWAPRALDDLLAVGAHVRVATEPFVAATTAGARRFDVGTIVIVRGLQRDVTPDELGDLLAAAGELTGVTVHALESGLTGVGIDLGSPSLRPLRAPEIALVVGPGVSMYEAGEAWHLLDHRFQMAVTLLDRERIARGRGDLGRYTHLILVDGEWNRMGDRFNENVAAFVESGGVLLAVKRAAQWAEQALLRPNQEGEETEGESGDDEAQPERRPYGSYRADQAVELVSGAIFSVDLDPTHPVAYGYRERALPVFRDSPLVFGPEPDPYTTVAAHTESPLLSGYASQENVDKIAGTPALTARRLGAGLVVRYAFDPNFRAFWWGTSKLFLNPLFFGSVVEPTAGGRQRDDGH